VRNHISKRVHECLMLRNHNIIVIIFSPVDLKKRLRRREADERFHLSTAQDKVKISTEAHGLRERVQLKSCILPS
jgi:hypothetical protein